MEVEGLRDHKGNVLYCMTRDTADYLRCDQDAHAIHGHVSASTGMIEFEHVTPGQWVLMLVHDRNSNGKLDKRLGIPLEGFAFSRNPPMRFGPPKSADVTFDVPPGVSSQAVRMKYIF